MLVGSPRTRRARVKDTRTFNAARQCAVVPSHPTPRRLASLFGVSLGAAAVYEHLSRRGSLTASQTAPLLGKSRSRAYEVLRELVAKGLAVEEPGRPARFHAASMRDALASLKEDLAEQASFVEQALRLVPVAKTAREPPKPQVAFFYGAQAMENEAARIARKAKRDLVLYCGDGENRLPRSEQLLAALRKAVRRGVRVRAFAAPSPEAANLLADLSIAPGSGFRGKVVAGLAPFSCVASEDQALFPLPVPKGRVRGVHGMRTDSADLARFTIRTLDHLVGEAEAERHVFSSMEEFAPRYAEALAAAQVEVCNIGGEGWSDFVRPPYYRWFQGHSERAAMRGVKLRGIVNNAPRELEFLRKFGASNDWEVRTRPWIPTWTSVIDRSQLFQALLTPAGVTMFRWSQTRTEVEFQLRLFEQAWKDAAPLHGNVPLQVQT